jgi:hypothetical protein
MAGVYKVVNTASVRNGPDKSSTKIGTHLKNTEVTVKRILTNAEGLEVAEIIEPSNGYVKLITSRGKVLLEKISDPPGAAEDSGGAGAGGAGAGGVSMADTADSLDPFGQSTVVTEVKKHRDEGWKKREEWEKREVKVSNIEGLQYFNTFEGVIKMASNLRKIDEDLKGEPSRMNLEERAEIQKSILKMGDIWFSSNRSNCVYLTGSGAPPGKMKIMDMIKCLQKLPRDIHEDILWCLKKYLHYKIEELQPIPWVKSVGGGKHKKKSKRRKTQKKKLKNRKSKRRTIKYKI